MEGIPDGTEDANHNGRWDPGETHALVQDTDGDGLQDGFEPHYLTGTADTNSTADSNHPGMWLFTAASSNTPTTSALDKDADDGGIPDNIEEAGSWCFVGEAGCTYGSSANSARITNPTIADTDGDGLLDGEEIGLTSGGVDTLTTVFRGDIDPSTHTDPTKLDTDGDGVNDGPEDMNKNWRVDSGEPNPQLWDTDGDGLCDGNWSGYGEDLNLNGYRDQSVDGNWTETDPLASWLLYEAPPDSDP